MGIEVIGLVPKETKFEIKYDPKKTDLDKILAALKEKGKSAKKL